MFTLYYINFMLGIWSDWKAMEWLSVQIVDDESVRAAGVKLVDKPGPTGWSVVNIQRAFIDEDGEAWFHYFEVVNISDNLTYGFTFSYNVSEHMWEVEHIKFGTGRPSMNETYMVDDCCVASWLKGLHYGTKQIPYAAPEFFPTENH